MIKQLFLAIVFTFLSINFYSQIGGSGTTAGGSGSGGSSCVSALFAELADCLSDNGISYSMLSSGNTLYLYASGSPPPGQITSCLVHYDNDRDDCSDAPVIVNHTGTAGGIKRAR